MELDRGQVEPDLVILVGLDAFVYLEPRAFESVAAKNVQKGIFKTQFLNAYLCCFNFSA